MSHHAPSLSILLCVRSEMKLAPKMRTSSHVSCVRPPPSRVAGTSAAGAPEASTTRPSVATREAVAASARNAASANARAEGRGDEAPPQTSVVDSAADMMAWRRPRDTRADVRDPRRTRRVTPPEIQTDER